MALQKESPYVCHVFVCTNDRGGERKSCADNKSPLIRKRLKEEMKTRGWDQTGEGFTVWLYGTLWTRLQCNALPAKDMVL